MKSILSSVILGGILIVVSCGSLARANVVLFDHFDGTTTGEAFGSVSFVPSRPGLGQAVNLEQGDWIRYTLPGWYQWSWNYNPSGKEGTFEMWVCPRRYGIQLAQWQWLSTSSPPSYGTIGLLYITEDGKVFWGGWSSVIGGPPAPPVGSTTIPLNQWTHLLATWHESGTELYVNGVLDSFAPYNSYPALNSTFYVYLNSWGISDIGYIDEVRILDIYTPQPTIIPVPAALVLCSVGVGCVSWLRRQRTL